MAAGGGEEGGLGGSHSARGVNQRRGEYPDCQLCDNSSGSHTGMPEKKGGSPLTYPGGGTLPPGALFDQPFAGHLLEEPSLKAIDKKLGIPGQGVAKPRNLGLNVGA